MSTTASKLCSICVRFDVRKLLLAAQALPPKTFIDPSVVETYEGLRPSLFQFFKQHPNLIALRASASECDLCRAIWQAHVAGANPSELSDEAMGQGISAKQIWIGTTPWDTTLNGLPFVAFTQHGDRKSMRYLASFEVCALRGYEPRYNPNLLARSIYANSGSAECLELAADLLSSCVTGHKSCSSQYPARSTLPTRVIDTDGLNPKLVDGAGRSDTFAALSYCWGGDTTFKLTRATETQFRTGRPLAEFPATLRDAITVTRALGIRYIWIDALCIIQDADSDDWAREAARMRDVYRGAVVTIAAACAAKASDGIFCDRQVPSEPRCWLDWRCGDEAPHKVFLRRAAERSDDRMNQNVLSTRGWILQETLLAPRTLWFGTEQICFECPKGSSEESGRRIRIMEVYRSKEYMQTLRQNPLPNWRRKLISHLKDRDIPVAARVPFPSLSTILSARDLATLRYRAAPLRHLTIQGNFKPPASTRGMSHWELWTKIIENYSLRVLTNTTDTLPALSGLANEFHRATGDTYVAGLWKEDILSGLCWTRQPSWKRLPSGKIEYQRRVPDKYLAPSWSWVASCGRLIIFVDASQYYKITPFAKVLNIDIQLAHQDPFGAVSGGSITINGPLLRLGTVDSLNSSQSPPTYPMLMKSLSPFLKDLVAAGHGENAGSQQVSLLMLLEWDDPIGRLDRACLLVLLGVEGEDSWRRVDLLARATGKYEIHKERREDALSFLREVKRDMRQQTVRII